MASSNIAGARQAQLVSTYGPGALFPAGDQSVMVCGIDDWDEQRMPAPHVRVATAAIRTSTALGPQWRRAAARLGVKRADDLTVLADGARWIWTEIDKNLPGAAGVLDIYHAGEHLHAAAMALHGAGPAAEAWYDKELPG